MEDQSVYNLIKSKSYRDRLEFYKKTGFTREAMCDRSWKVRIEAYRKLGFTQNSLHDPSSRIREEANVFFRREETIIVKILMWLKSKIQ